MATQQMDITTTCLICLDSKPLKVVGKCTHSFCAKCLETVFSNLDDGCEVFQCPTCKVDCQRPEDGVTGLKDFTGEIEPGPKENEIGHDAENGEIVVINCDICLDKNKKMQAVKFCLECHNLNFCQDCAQSHGKKKATRAHMLTPILTKKEEKRMCKRHNKLLIKFCQTCGVPACNICVCVEHGDHEVRKLVKVIRSEVEKVKATLGAWREKLKEMQDLERELTLLKAMAPIVDKQDTLIKEIEDHAQECIDTIVKWKEDLKNEVKTKYKVIQDIPLSLETVSETVRKLQEPINRAEQQLSQMEHHPEYLDKLATLQANLDGIAGVGDKVEGWEYREILHDLHNEDWAFEAVEALADDFGELNGQPFTRSEEFEPKEIFRLTMPRNFEDAFIPCVATLGNKYYAIAHPCRNGELTNAIDIYRYPGTKTNTLKDHVTLVYDMTSTPDGKLAVLSNGTADATCSVKLFDPETGYISSTHDIKIAKPLSLGVTLLQQYVILGTNEEGREQITVVTMDRAVELEYVIDEDGDSISNCNRITCGSRCIFVSGGRDVAVFEITNAELQRIDTLSWDYIGEAPDISATIHDDIFLVEVNADDDDDDEVQNVYLNLLRDKENQFEWSEILTANVEENVAGADRETRVAASRDGHNVVLSFGRTVLVYKC